MTTLQKNNRKTPWQSTMTFRVDPDVRDRLAVAAKRIGLNTSSLVRLFMTQYLESLEENEKQE